MTCSYLTFHHKTATCTESNICSSYVYQDSIFKRNKNNIFYGLKPKSVISVVFKIDIQPNKKKKEQT